MSMSAGGLAQMTYSNFGQNGGLGVPTSGFASRGKGSHIARLAVPAAPASGPTDNNLNTPTPRTSRSHLLANLRTAPKSPGFPPSAPPSQMQHSVGLDGSRYAEPENRNPTSMAGPKTSVGSGFPSQHSLDFSARQVNTSRQMYSLPEQVLAPPTIQVGPDQGEEQMDPSLYAELVATNLYLAQQQQRLQQQLISVTAAAQQFNGLNLNGQMAYQQQQQSSQQQYMSSPTAANMGLYGQQQQQQNGMTGMQQVVTPVAGAQPGLYSVYNPLTGQHGYFIDPNAPQPQYAPSPPNSSPEIGSPAQPSMPLNRSRFSSPPPQNSMPPPLQRNTSSPKPTTSPAQASPSLPPPSANAFRRGHKKASSGLPPINAAGATTSNGSGANKSSAYPLTPMNTTFGPGQARAGEHPVRQPRGPPPLEELVSHPTTKHEGSKNFATRQRRRAVHSLVRAGLERRGNRGSGSGESTASMTPVSESDITFSVHSDNDSDSLGSGSLSGKPSLGSLRAAANGAIGSERKKERSRERDSLGSQFSTRSVSSDEGAQLGGKLVEVKSEGVPGRGKEQVRKTPLLVFTSAEKRKSSIF